MAAVLDIRTTDSALPAVVVCPMCGGKLSVYEDNRKNGAWHHCADCGSTGDLVRLAASAWRISEDDAILRLVDRDLPLATEAGTPSKLPGPRERAVLREQRVREFWEACRENLLRCRSAAVNTLRARFRLRCDAPDHRWRANGGLVLGAADRHAAERACQASTSKRLFIGRGWGDTLVVAYHDMPERPSSFFFVGRDGGVGDRVYRRIHDRGRPGAADDFGLAGLPCVMASSYRSVVAVDDPLLLARLHCRQTSLSAAVLPIVAWHDGHDGRTRQGSYACLGDRRIVFWSWRPDYRHWLQAMSCDGWVCDAGPETTGQKTVDHYLRSLPPLDIYRRINRMAVPWREGLASLVESESIDRVEALFSRFKAARVDVIELAEMMPGKAREIALRAVGVREAIRSASVDGHAVVEANGGWHWRRGGQLVRLTTFVLRLRHVTSKGLTVHYHGDMIKDGRTVPFALTGTQMASRARPLLQAVAHRGGLGTLHIRGGWAARLLRVAAAFSPPLEAPEAP